MGWEKKDKLPPLLHLPLPTRRSQPSFFTSTNKRRALSEIPKGAGLLPWRLLWLDRLTPLTQVKERFDCAHHYYQRVEGRLFANLLFSDSASGLRTDPSFGGPYFSWFELPHPDPDSDRRVIAPRGLAPAPARADAQAGHADRGQDRKRYFPFSFSLRVHPSLAVCHDIFMDGF